MRALFVLLITASSLASAGEDLSIGSPLKDDRKIIAGRVGDSPGDVSARGLLVNGKRGDLPFTQAGGEVVVQGALHFFQASFGGILGAEADFSLGGASNEASPDGTVADQRRDNKTTEGRTKSLVWVTSRLSLRASLSLPILQLGDRVAFRLGALGGPMLEANGSRSFEFSPGFTAGAQLSFVVGPIAGLATYLAMPTQGEAQKTTSHKLSLELGIGPIAVGASWQRYDVSMPQKSGVPAFTVASEALALHVGYRFPALNVR